MAFQERLAQRHAAFKRGAEVGDLQQRLRDFTAELWRQEHEEKLWRHRGAGMNTEESMEVDGLEVDAMFLEDLMSRLPVLRARLISASPPEQLDALRELRQMCSGEVPLRIFGDIPKCLVRLLDVDLVEVKIEALAMLADLASTEKGANLVSESGALPICVRLLQSSEELREEAFRVLHEVHEKSEVF